MLPWQGWPAPRPGLSFFPPLQGERDRTVVRTGPALWLLLEEPGNCSRPIAASPGQDRAAQRKPSQGANSDKQDAGILNALRSLP